MIRRAFAAAAFANILAAASAQEPAPETPLLVADGVWMLPSKDIGRHGSNVAWVAMPSFVVVFDAAFPLGAERALRHIETTVPDRPVRYVVLTHHHADHSFGAGAFAGRGATVIAQTNAAARYRRELASYAERQERDAAARAHPAHPPDITFDDRLCLTDGDRRVELLWFGHAHTSGDLFGWLPEQRVLFTGDACVNGPYNFLGDADTASWIEVLARAETLGADHVVPGHGPPDHGGLLATQRRYFEELRAQVAAAIARGSPLPRLRGEVDVPMWREWTGMAALDPRAIDHVYGELTRGTAAHLGAAPDRTVAVAVAPGAEPPRRRFLSGPLDATERGVLRALAGNVEIVEAGDAAAALAHAGDIDGIDARFCSSVFLRAAPRLRWVQAMSAGVERHVAVRELVDNDAIVLTNMAGAFGTAIADHAMAMLLSLTRSLGHYRELQQSGSWERSEPPRTDELTGKTMLIVGLGGIGRELARRAHGFGMQVWATDPATEPRPAYVDRIAPPAGLDAMLPAADVVALCVPLTPQTRGLFAADRLAAMKPGSYLLNVGRGQVVDTAALTDALRRGPLAGAGLDVVDPEPLPPHHPLWSLPNVVITPHASGRSELSERRRFEIFAENMRRFARGLPLLNVVDKRAGY